jgi:hypothetical protein
VRFWDDIWIWDKPLKTQYPNLCNIARDPQATIFKIMATSPLNISFRRALVDNNLREWLGLVAQISHVQLTEGSDFFKMEPNQVRLVHCPVFVSPSYWYTSTVSASEDLEDDDSTKDKDFSLVSKRGLF